MHVVLGPRVSAWSESQPLESPRQPDFPVGKSGQLRSTLAESTQAQLSRVSTVSARTILTQSMIDIKKIMAWGESGFPARFLVWCIRSSLGIKVRPTPVCHSASSKNPFCCPFGKPRNNATNYEYRTLVLQRRVDVPLRESFVAQGLLRQLLDVHLRREWASGERPIPNASL